MIPVPEGPALGVRRAVGRRGRAAPVHVHRHHRHRLRRPDRRPADHARRHRVPPARDQRRGRPRRSPRPTSSARGPGSGRSSPRPRASAPPTSRAATRVHTSPSGVVTVTGGKLTTYRRMAADAVDEVVQGARPRRAAAAARSGSRCTAPTGWDAPDIPPHLGRALRRRRTRRGRRSNAPTRSSRRPLDRRASPYSRAEVVYAVRAEMARTVDDVLSRRTRARLLARDASAAAADDVAALMAAELGWSDDERDRQVAQYRALIDEERTRGRPARDRARRPVAPARRDSVVSPRADEPGGADSSHRVRRRGDVARPPADRRASRSTTQLQAKLARDRRRGVDAPRPRSARRAATGGRSR